jgi:hypothetical protein
VRPPILTGDQWMRDVNRRLVSLEMRSSSSGSAGTPGPPGTPGSKWYSGDGAPSGSLGVVGDWYMDDVDGSVYEKTASTTWTLRDNLTGPQGEPGVSVGNVSYRYRDASTASDPGHGNIKANTTDPALATEWYASVYDTEGAIVRFDWVEVGGTFAIYVSGDVDTWDRYEVTGPVVNHGNEWFTIPAVWNSSGPLPFNPANGTRVQVQTPVRGEPGPQGPPGEQGEPGEKGDPGAAGPPNTLTIGTVTTGPSAATITGTSPNQVLNLTLAQGVKGDKGDQGDQGSPGIPGIQGIQGEPGVKGDPGAPGEKWFSGTGAPAGATGIVGDWYLDTSTGDVYEKTGASAWTSRGNIRGPQGIQGEPGPPGSAAGLPPATPEGALFTAVGGAWVADTTPVVTSLTTPSINPGAGALTITGQVTMNMDLAVPTGTIAGAVLRATSAAATTLAGTAHAIQAGPTATANLALDSTSIQARNNGAASILRLNSLGGPIQLGDATSLVTAPGSLRASSANAVTLTTTDHPATFGDSINFHLAMGGDIVQARNWTDSTTLRLNPFGGQVTVGAAGGTYIPGSPESVATKKYVDDRPPNAHTHAAADITSGRFGNATAPWVELKASVDLNTVLTPGTYYWANASDATLGNNFPVANVAGALLVTANSSGSMIWQEYTSAGQYPKRWVRNLWNSAWRPWTAQTNGAVTVHSGRVQTAGVVTVNTVYNIAISFPTGTFLTTPNVVVTAAGTSPHLTAAGVSGPSTTGATLNLIRTSGTAQIFADWIASEDTGAFSL